MNPHTETLSVVFFSDFQHSTEKQQSFSSFSYGDADYTIVRASVLINELTDTDEAPNLLRELLEIDPDTLIAF